MEPEDDDEMQDVEPAWRALSILPCGAELERSDPNQATLLYEKAILENAGSYKLWHAYLLHRTRTLEGKPINDKVYDEVNNSYEKALVFMHKMPRIWIEYCSLLDRQLFVTRTRRNFDKALEALPVTQHSRIWPLYLEFIKKDHVPVETAVRVFRRYMQFKPEDAECFIEYLYVNNRFDEAASLLCDIINRPNFQSKNNKTKYQLWEELCDMICEYADKIESIDAEAVLRDGITRYRESQGRLWNSLAKYHIQLGMFENARDVYDEAIHSVTTKKDFVEIWDAYTKFEEKYLELLLEQDEPDESQLSEIEIRQASLEKLVTNSALLLNRVALRQNPHNVREWQKRVKTHDDLESADDAKEETYVEALKTVDPKQALGNYEELWIDYAMLHAESGRTSKAREVFEKAVEANYARYDDLAKVWCAYIEYELKIQSGDALKLAYKATSSVKNFRLWSLCIDLEENFGSFESTKAAYERVLDLKIATPQLILNYASFLEEKNYYEESFRVFERGTSLFKWPTSVIIWHTYISKYLTRYGDKKLYRVRELFEQCLKDCPANYCFDIFILYAKIEEESGHLSNAREIYNRAVGKIEVKRKPELYRIYIRSMMKLADIPTIRSTYELAIANLDNKSARDFCLEYANLEEGLEEIDRARTIYSHCSQMCDPRKDPEFWKLWLDFEQRFGELETIDDMLRIKRSVEALYPKTEYLTDVNLIT